MKNSERGAQIRADFLKQKSAPSIEERLGALEERLAKLEGDLLKIKKISKKDKDAGVTEGEDGSSAATSQKSPGKTS